ncbi:hypothetical protein K440DRAFT_425763 [Wilcoxina mikolae CBS 423.85]|nr:hypothetical protein K440DRAFT_425763 [Wilcoxina mikolae CBS 423.85]
MVIFFPKFQSDVVPMRIPFAFAHHISTTIALLNFFKCLCNTSFSFPDIYPGAAVQIFRNCNPVNIHEGHGHNQSSRYDYTGRNRTFGEAKQEFIKSVLDKEGSQGWILLLLLCPTSSMLRWYRTIKYGFVRKDGEKLTILSIPEIWRIHGMKDLELAEPSKKLWESEVGKGFVKGWGCHIPIELLTEEDIQKLEKWDGLSTIVLICQNRGIA